MEGLGHTLCLLEPELDLVTIRVGDVGEGKARRELALTEKLTARAFYCCDGVRHIFRPLQAKPEVSDATGGACLLGRTFERQDVEWPRPPDLNLVRVPEVLANSERLDVELQRPLRIAYRKADMRKPVGLDHGCG